MPEPDKGNPNAYTIFKGRYAVTLEDDATSDNSTVMLTNTNDVQFCGDYTAGVSGVLGQLPESCRPVAEVSVICYDSTLNEVSRVNVGDDGTIMGTPNSTHMLRGCTFNISGNFYK